MTERDDSDAAREGAAPVEGTVRKDRQAYLKALAEGLAHELKNPLSILRMNIQLLREEAEDEDSVFARKIKRRGEILEMQTRRLQETLDEFLRFARGAPVEITRCNVNELLQELLDFTAGERPKNDVRLLTDLPDDVPEIEADPNLLKQALLNIILNAEQAMPEGGELIIRTAPRNERVEIEITDTGTGIPPENVDAVFQIYFSTKEGGTGLGLATARRIIEQHGGAIRLFSTVGKGTSFHIALPVRWAGDSGSRQPSGENDGS